MTVVAATVLVHSNEVGFHEVLRKIASQSRPPDVVIVVDNGSARPLVIPADVRGLDVRLITLKHNVGVGAGHNAGVRSAIDIHGCEVVWLLEHDTFPDPDCLAMLLAERSRHSQPVVVVPAVTRNNYERSWLDPNEPAAPVARFTLNGPLLDRDVFHQVGYLIEDYFVGQEDWDYSQRVVDAGVHVTSCPPASVVHANKGDGRFDSFVSPTRLYYSARNLVASAQPATGSERAKGLLVTLAKCARELFTPGRGRAYVAARWWAYSDGTRSRLGQRHHRFMR